MKEKVLQSSAVLLKSGEMIRAVGEVQRKVTVVGLSLLLLIVFSLASKQIDTKVNNGQGHHYFGLMKLI